jgi:novel plant SNARE
MGDGPEKTGIFERIEKHLRAAQGTKRSFKMETRLVADVNARRKYETRLQRLDQQLNTLQADCKALRQEHERGELFEGQGGGGEGGPNEEDGQKAGDNMLKEAMDLQNKTQDSLGNTKAMIAASKEVGMATLEELERQRDVLSNIEKEIDRVDDNLARAEALMKQFGKRMASDKFIQCFAVINCLLLLGVILYAVLKPGGMPGSDEATPVSPLDNTGAPAPTRYLRHW